MTKADAAGGERFASWRHWREELLAGADGADLFQTALKTLALEEQNMIRSRSRLPMRLSLPFLEYPIWMRSGTSDISVLRQVFIEGHYDLGKKIGVDPQLIVDGGAHIGFTTIFLAQCFPKARIIAIEPEAGNCEILSKNVERYKNVDVLNAALWSSECLLRIVDPCADTWSYQTAPATTSQDAVAGISMQGLSQYAGGRRIDLLKLDIEGSEQELLRVGHAGWLDDIGTLVIELHERKAPGVTDAFNAAITGRRYTESHSGDNRILEFVRNHT